MRPICVRSPVRIITEVIQLMSIADEARTMSDPDSNPITGTDLGAGVQGEPQP